jgi:hypothetical protein
LNGLIDAGVPEGALIDYKRALYGRSDAEVKEYLKDISSFATPPVVNRCTMLAPMPSFLGF